LADHAQSLDGALEHFTLGVLARLEGSEPQVANSQLPTALNVCRVLAGDFAPAF
jgi:hypothetical protein